MACGAPVLGTDSPGIRELIRHGNTGYLCGTDSEDIRLALKELLTRPKLLKELGSNARQYVVENYSLTKIGNMELKMLQEVADRQ